MKMPAMPATLKQAHMLKKVAGYHVQRKQAHTLHIISDLLDNLPFSSDTQTYSDTSNSSTPPSSSSLMYSASSPSSASSCFNSFSLTAYAGHSSSSSENFRSLKGRLLEWWDDYILSSDSLPAYSSGSRGLSTHNEVRLDRTVFDSLLIRPPSSILKKTICLPNCLQSPYGAHRKPQCLS